MQHMKKSSEKQRTQVDEDELIALNAWRDRPPNKRLYKEKIPTRPAWNLWSTSFFPLVIYFHVFICYLAHANSSYHI
jgi:hypothetical protein